MTPEQQHDLLTRTAPGTPCGDLMRRYWQPVALSEELPPGGPPVPARLLGEDLVLFRGESGQPSLLGLHCSHRGADLSYGRLEDGGLRCIYHGWLYDLHGSCLEQPGEPAGSTFHDKIRHSAYPCVERARTIFAYLGPGEPPEFPNYEFLQAPMENVTATKRYHECNYLQANEGNIDLSHLSFLHYMTSQNRRGGPPGDETLNPRGAAPGVESSDVEVTPYGVRSYRISRDVGPDSYRFDLTEYVLPNFTAFWTGPNGDLSGKLGYSVNWHVPIDDTHHSKYTFRFGRLAGPGDWGAANRPRTQLGDGYQALRNLSNRFLQDREEQKTTTYTGLGPDFFLHDKWATESQGPIQDWSAEHLGALDRAIPVARKVLQKAIEDLQEGHEPANVVRDPAKNSFPIVSCYVTVPASTDWRQYRQALEAEVFAAGPEERAVV